MNVAHVQEKEWEIPVVFFPSLRSGEYIFGFIELSFCGHFGMGCIVLDVGHDKFTQNNKP